MPIPGPKYALPSTIGHEGHDPTMSRSPAWSVGFRQASEQYPKTPAPKYNVDKVWRKGVLSVPTPVLAAKGLETNYQNGVPAPNRYAPHNFPDPGHRTAPSAVLAWRTEYSPRQITPGPKYYIKGSIAREIEDLPNVPAWSILGRPAEKTTTSINSPGPAKYGMSNLNRYKSKAPEWALSSRHAEKSSGIIPGPKYLGNHNRIMKEAPSWSLGVRHSPNQAMFRTEEDNRQYFVL